MTYVLIALIITGALSHGTEWNADRNRVYWFWMVLALAAAWALPNPWLTALAALIFLRVLWLPDRMGRILNIDDVLAVVALTAILVPHLTAEMVPVILWTILAVCGWSSLYALISWWKFDKEKGYSWQWTIPYLNWTIRLYEYQAHIAGGQGNPNHLHGLMVVGIAASIGLFLLGAPSLWAIPMCLLTMAILQFTKTTNPGTYRHPQQGWAHLVALGLASLPLVVGVWGWMPLLVTMLAVGVMLVRNRHDDTGWDSGRGFLWWKMMTRWWADGWLVRVLGWGPKEFGAHHSSFVVNELAPQTGQVILAHNPHNEYVCQLLEYGIVGVVLLLGYIITTALKLLALGPTGWALYLVGVTLCSIAFTSFPWTYYREILFQVMSGNPGEPNAAIERRIFTMGTPALVAISYVTVLLIEAVVR